MPSRAQCNLEGRRLLRWGDCAQLDQRWGLHSKSREGGAGEVGRHMPLGGGPGGKDIYKGGEGGKTSTQGWRGERLRWEGGEWLDRVGICGGPGRGLFKRGGGGYAGKLLGGGGEVTFRA